VRVAVVGSRGYPSDYGGFETFVRRLAPHLRDAGDEVTVYGRATHAHATEEIVDGIRCVRTAGIDRKSISTLVSGFTSSLHARGRQFDAALVLNCANGLWLPILRQAGIPCAVNVDGIEWERDKWGRVGKQVFVAGARATARWADRVVVDSLEIGRIWQERFGVGSTFIPYGADAVSALPDEKVRELGLEPGSYLLVVARLVPENNVELFLEALDLLPPDLPAVIVGSANYDSPVEVRLRRALAARPTLVATGHVSDQDLLAQLWAHALLYFHGHSVGGTNPALLQALGYGCPTVALDTPYNREVLQRDDQLVARSPRMLADRIRELLGDESARVALREHGRAVVSERYRWDDVCARYREVLVDLASRGR
jgi:glycosyltransferase involved in cell wall biosynthesis